MKELTRRAFIKHALGAGGMLAMGISCARPGSDSDPFADGKLVESMSFLDGKEPLQLGDGLDARFHTDLAALAPATLITSNEQFFVRTRCSTLIDFDKPWKIAVRGLVERPGELDLDDLRSSVKPMGTVLLECAGNQRRPFGLMSAARWSGISLAAVLERSSIKPEATRVLVSGFDQYSVKPHSSTPGASWVFSFEDIEKYGAFLATEMNGEPLSKDHGFPARLVVPRWFSCVDIKWVNEIVLVNDSERATSQMLEFATRINQQGTPRLSKDFDPALIDQAALPVRIEKWRVSGQLVYRVVGLMWGGERPTDKLMIRFGGDEDPVRVNMPYVQESNDTWTLWSHAWKPARMGFYDITMHIDDASIRTWRLDRGLLRRRIYIRQV
jgi:DMSO/TMAO reductase YedYZ molybdopterin-dependent catalytic subunit